MPRPLDSAPTPLQLALARSIGGEVDTRQSSTLPVSSAVNSAMHMIHHRIIGLSALHAVLSGGLASTMNSIALYSTPFCSLVGSVRRNPSFS